MDELWINVMKTNKFIAYWIDLKQLKRINSINKFALILLWNIIIK